MKKKDKKSFHKEKNRLLNRLRDDLSKQRLEEKQSKKALKRSSRKAFFKRAIFLGLKKDVAPSLGVSSRGSEETAEAISSQASQQNEKPQAQKTFDKKHLHSADNRNSRAADNRNSRAADNRNSRAAADGNSRSADNRSSYSAGHSNSHAVDNGNSRSSKSPIDRATTKKASFAATKKTLIKAPSSLLAIFLLLSLGVIWGSGYSIAHYATTHHVPAMGYTFWQSLGPAVCLSLWLLVTRQRLCLKKQSLVLYAVSGLIGIALPNSIMYFTSAHVAAGLLAVVVNTVPLFTFFIALCLRDEGFYWPRALGVLCCFLGLWQLYFPVQGLAQFAITHWLSLALISPICFAFCAVIISRYQPPTCSAPSLATGMLLASSIWLLPVIFWQHDFYMPHLPWQRQDSAVVLEIFLSSIGYIIFCKLLKLAGSVYYSMVGGVVAIVGLIWGYILFAERLSRMQLLAVAFIVASIFLLSCFSRKKNVTV